jgi:hypothetical protein
VRVARLAGAKHSNRPTLADLGARFSPNGRRAGCCAVELARVWDCSGSTGGSTGRANVPRLSQTRESCPPVSESGSRIPRCVAVSAESAARRNMRLVAIEPATLGLLLPKPCIVPLWEPSCRSVCTKCVRVSGDWSREDQPACAIFCLAASTSSGSSNAKRPIPAVMAP